MSGSLNKVMLIGRLGKDPEIKYTDGGNTVAKFSIATDETWKDKSGEKQSKTTWINIVIWGKLAEVCGQFLKKGSQAFFEGKISVREWEDKEGHKRTTTEVVANNMVMLGGNKDSSGSGAPKSSGGSTQHRYDEPGDDIPF